MILTSNWNQAILRKQKFFFLPKTFFLLKILRIFFFYGLIYGFLIQQSKLKVHLKYNLTCFIKNHFFRKKMIIDKSRSIVPFSFYLTHTGIVSGALLKKSSQAGIRLFSFSF